MRPGFLAAAAALLALSLAPADLAAQDEGKEPEFTMRVGSVAPERTPWADLLKFYKKSVEKASNGRIKVRVFLGGVKGDEQSLVRQVHGGTSLQLAGVSTGAMATLVPDLDILELPYLFDSYEEADRILDGAARPIIEKLLDEKGFKLVMFSENGFRSFGTKGGFIKKPSDLKAKKMRAQESPVHVQMYRALDASPVTIPVGEVMSALQTGVVQGFDNTPLFTQAVSWHQAIDHYTVSEHIYQPALLAVNKAWFEKLPPELQQAVLGPQKDLERKGRQAVRALNPLLIKNFENQSPKVNVHTHTPEERAAFQKVTRPTWDQRRASAAELGKQLYDTIIQAKGAK